MTFFEYLKFIFCYAKHYRLAITVFTVGIIIQVIYLLIIPLAYRQIFDEVIPTKDINNLLFLSLLLGFGLLIKIGVELFTEYCVSYIGTKMCLDLRRNILSKVQNLNISKLRKIKNGEIIAYFSTDLSAIENSFILVTSFIFKHLLLAICTLFLLFYFEVHLAIIVTLMLPLPIIISHYTSKKALSLGIIKKNQEANILALYNQIAQEQPTIQAYNLQKFWFNKITKKFKTFMQTCVSAYFFNSIVARAMILTSQSTEIIVVLTSAFFAINGYCSVGTVIGFWVFYTYLSTAFDGTAEILPTIFSSISGATRIHDFLNIKEEDQHPESNCKNFLELKSHIEFKNASFDYNNNRAVIKSINLKIFKGKSVAIVGSSGAGKSTLLSLLLKFYELKEGEILIDNVNIKDLSATSLRDKMRIVFQDNVVFDLSIADNIRLGKLNAKFEEIVEAATNAELHEYIISLPLGYNTLIGERGCLLSGGQRQRLSLARAIISKPKILLLDEITSALDLETEKEINKTIAKIMHENTTIMITHRLYSVISADQIYVLHKGQIIESGTHIELLEKNGYYSTLWEKQK